MKNSTIEPPGSRLAKQIHKRKNVVTLPKEKTVTLVNQANALDNTVANFRSVDDMVHEMRPEMPVYCLRPSTIAATVRLFLKAFPGDVLYAVKTNPDPRVLSYLAKAGVTHYDVASIAEVKLVAENVPGAKLFFMHPVKSREAIERAYFDYGVRDFSLDTVEELNKILDVTNGARDLNLYVRLAMSNEKAAYSLSGKFGIAPEHACLLMQAVRAAANKLGVCFHVGSQCMDPEAYTQALELVTKLLEQSAVKLDVLDIGGGFPSIYPGMTPPALGQYMKAIKKAVKGSELLEDCQLICEPGRALVAEGGSTVARVEARKGNMLYLNEGVYGSLFDAGTPGFQFPVKAIRPDAMKQGGALSSELVEFGFYGPTCDSLDTMKGPFALPANIAEGDWIEIGQLGSYGFTMRTQFNGFHSDTTVEVADKPLLSVLGVN
jgi:ornithine decarboxylase